jgi:hypothetical protein
MKAVITGDIINSRKVNTSEWINVLRKTLKENGEEPKDWEIYRGDSFQLITDTHLAFEVAMKIKSSIKQNKKLDVRMAIGIGKVEYRSKKIIESNGTAFINSGECFESLKKQTLAIKTPWEEFNKTFHVIFQLTSLASDNWTTVSS